MTRGFWSRASVLSRVALPLALVAFVPAGVGLYLTQRHSDRLHAQQVVLARALRGVRLIRADLARATREADRTTCDRQNASRRAVVASNRILLALIAGVDGAAATRNPVRDAAFAHASRDLRRQNRALRPLDCSALATQRARPR